jgi:hypothetical protein
LDEVRLDAQQILGEQILDVRLPFLDEVHLEDVVVDVELRHLLRMDCYQDVALVDEELRHL